ncbi:hypothetical protein ASZ90_017170 [hydrocarbon metagenome]|uniref:Uncharacterized protein n=1 Tax=hydrocarbon metagenome TaxID=938273 RepID=A0A0W8EAA4_9ZZZZ
MYECHEYCYLSQNVPSSGLYARSELSNIDEYGVLLWILFGLILYGILC